MTRSLALRIGLPVILVAILVATVVSWETETSKRVGAGNGRAEQVGPDEAVSRSESSVDPRTPPPEGTAPRSSRVVGSVVDESDVGLRARIIVRSAQDARALTSSESGAFELNLPPGTWSYSCRSSGHYCARGTVLVPGDGTLVRVRIELHDSPDTDVLLLTKSGHPIRLNGSLPEYARPYVIVTRDKLPSRVRGLDVRHAGLGWFSPHRHPKSDGSIGTLNWRAEGPMFVSLLIGDEVVGSQEFAAAPERLTFELDASESTYMTRSVFVRVIDGETHEPLERAGVAVDSAASRSIMIGQAQLGPDGGIDLGPRGVGLSLLRVRARGYGSVQKWVMIPRAETADLGTVRLRRSASVSGRVTNARGDGCAAKIRVLPAGESPLEMLDPRFRNLCGPDGVFRLTELTAGRVTLLIEMDGYATKNVSMKLPVSGGIEVVLQEGVPILVVGADRWELPHFVSISSGSGVVWARHLTQRSAPTIRLESGTHMVRVTSSDGTSRDRGFEVTKTSRSLVLE